MGEEFFKTTIRPYLYLIYNESDEVAFFKRLTNKGIGYEVLYDDEEELCVLIGEIEIKWHTYGLEVNIGEKNIYWRES